jgi:hypothetical protein
MYANRYLVYMYFMTRLSIASTAPNWRYEV